MRAYAFTLALMLGMLCKACSCIDEGLAGQFAIAHYVIEAVPIGSRVIEVTDSTGTHRMREIRILVGKVYKGDMPKGPIRILTRDGGAACGVFLPLGGRYLIFGGRLEEIRSSDGPSYMRISSSACMGNRFYPFWRLSLRKNIRRLVRDEKIPQRSRWAKVPSW